MRKAHIIKNLEENLGLDTADAIEIFESYKCALKDNIRIMQMGLSPESIEITARAAHSIKGCALNCGDEEMATVAKMAQLAALAKDFNSFDDAFEKIKNMALEVFSEKN